MFTRHYGFLAGNFPNFNSAFSHTLLESRYILTDSTWTELEKFIT